jgi:hypothetical protein
MTTPDPRKAMADLMNSSLAGRNATASVGASRTGPTNTGGTRSATAQWQRAQPRGVTKARIVEELGGLFNDLWNASQPHATNLPTQGVHTIIGNPTTPKNEQGCWIMYNNGNDSLRTVTFTAPSTRDSCIPGTPQLNANERIVAFFHTHPNTREEGYARGPSPADISYATTNGYAGVMRAQTGGYEWFGPNPQ